MPYQYGGEIDYSSSELIKGSYRLQRLNPREGAGDGKITTAGGQENSFDLISRPFNLSKSVLSFNYAIPPVDAKYVKTFMDCLAPIRQIQLKTRSGAYLCDLNDVGNITKMMWKADTSFKDLQAMENHDIKMASAGNGAGCMLQKCNANNQLYFTQTAAEYKAAFIDTNGSLADLAADLKVAIQRPATNARRHDDAAILAGTGVVSAVNVGFMEAKYFAGAAVGNTGGADAAAQAANTAASTAYVNVKLNLGMLYNTIFALDKTIMFNEILTLRIVWAATPKIYYTNDDAKSLAGGTPVEAVGTVVVSDLNLFLATETNPNVILELQNKINSPGGMSFNIDYPMVYKRTLTGTKQNVVIRFDAGHGKRLRRLYHCVNNIAESKNTCYDIDNRNGTKITSFYTTLDGARQQEFDVSPARYEDYMLLKPKLEASALMNSDVYQYNWFWCDYFDNNRPFWAKDQSEVSGLELSTERRWEFISTIPATPAAAGLHHYTLAVLQRTVVVTSTNVLLDNGPAVAV